jgi:hypothetical protein
MRGFFLRSAGLLLTLLVVSCAGSRNSGSSPDSIASAQISADAARIFPAATEVLSRYSYSVSRVQYPTSATFEKTGNSVNRLAAGSPAFLTLHVEPAGSGSRVSLSGERAIFQAEAVKSVLEEIKAASH